MVERVTYVAFDGKEFDDRDECEDYEMIELSEKYGKKLFVYDEDDNLIPLDEDYRVCQDSHYIICETKEALDYLNQIFDGEVNQIDYYGNFPVSFYYDEEYERWKEITSHIQELQEEIDTFSKYIVKE